MKIKHIILLMLISSAFLYSQKKDAYSKGLIEFNSDKYEESIASFSEAIEKNINKKQSFYYRGLAFLYIQDVIRAIDDFSSAIIIDSNYSDAYNNRALAYGYNGKLDSALFDLQKAIKIDPEFAEAYLNLGSLQLELKKYDEAQENLSKAIKIDLKNPETYFLRATIYYQKKNYKDAITDYTKAERLGLKNSKLYYNRANAYYRNQEFLRAVYDYGKVLAKDSNDVQSLNNRAMAYEKLGDTLKANSDRTKMNLLLNKSESLTPIDSIVFVKFTDSTKRFGISYPKDWFVTEFNDSNTTEVIITREKIKDKNQPYLLGFRLCLNKNMKKQFNISGISELIKFWEVNNQQNLAEYYKYDLIQKKTFNVGNFKGSLNKARLQFSQESLPVYLYEIVIATDEELFFGYLQAPELRFDYYEQILDKIVKTFWIN